MHSWLTVSLNRFFSFLVCCLLVQATSAATYDLTDLGPVYALGQAEMQEYVVSMNDNGVITGWRRADANRGTPKEVFVWDATNGMEILPSNGTDQSIAYAINANNHVVGWTIGTDGTKTAAYWFKNDQNVWELISMGSLGGDSYAKGLNANGLAVGHAVQSDGSSTAFIWDVVTGMQPLLLPDAVQSFAYSINDAAQIIGDYVGSDRVRRSFIWEEAEGAHDIVPLGGDGTRIWVTQINNDGTVAGGSQSAANVCNGWACWANYHAFVWDHFNEMRDLSENYFGNTWANSVNVQNIAVGAIYTYPNPIAAIWENGIMDRLINLIDAEAGWFLSEATSINAGGQITGLGILNNVTHVFLLTPQSLAAQATVATPESTPQVTDTSDNTVRAATESVPMSSPDVTLNTTTSTNEMVGAVNITTEQSQTQDNQTETNSQVAKREIKPVQAANEPQPVPTQTASASASEDNGSGGGCTLNPSAKTTDPMLPVLVLLSGLFIFYRQIKQAS